MRRAKEEGVEGLRHKPPPGAPPRLSERERAELPDLLAQGAPAHGFRGEAWTCQRVAIVIRREFGVGYHPARVSRLVRSLGLSPRKPSRRANQRNEEAIEHWKERRWPSLKKGLRGKAGPSSSATSRASFFRRWWFAPTLRWERRPSSTSVSLATISRR